MTPGHDAVTGAAHRVALTRAYLHTARTTQPVHLVRLLEQQLAVDLGRWSLARHNAFRIFRPTTP